MPRLAAMLLAALAVSSSAAAQDARRLERMVIQDCGSCHGLSMKGGLGKPLTREALAETAPESIAAIILDGVPGTAMPPWRPLVSDDEALWMANFLKSRSSP